MTNKKVSHPDQVLYLRRYTLSGGKEDGVRVCELYNGQLRVLLNESRALDVMQVFHGGVNLSFISKNGFSLGERDFASRFEGGMLYTCGLDALGAIEGLEMHGSLHLHPARVTLAECTEEAITVRAELEDTALFGKRLRLCRTVTLRAGESRLRIEDELTNLGTAETPYCLLYHVNLGYPMLDEGVRILSDATAQPRNDYAALRAADRTVFTAPRDGEEERCYFLTHTEPCVRVENDRLGKAFILRYSGDTLPCFVQWCSAASGCYALGLEPSTSLLDEGFAYKTIASAATVRFSLSLSVETR